MNGNILIVDDDRNMCEMLATDLALREIDVTWTTSPLEALRCVNEPALQAVLTDLKMPELTGIQLCERIVANRPDVPVVVMTAFGDLEAAIGAIRAGAYDFVTKPVALDLLAVSLRRAIRHHQLQEQVKQLREAAGQLSDFGHLLGNSESMRDLFRQIEALAEADATVLICGESGTGKELVARSIHDHSRRRAGPFVAVNCAAIPETLFESTLFGHAKGAFTDALAPQQGLLMQADGGTLFLDEIGDLPLTLQAKLLRVLEQRRLRPVGGDQEHAFDVRLLSATHHDLEAAVDEGRFRSDLMFRINVVQIHVPALRARDQDILLLAQHFLEGFARQTQQLVQGLSTPVAEKLLDYDWPGNVRELRNVMERAVALRKWEQIVVDDLPEKIRDYTPSQFSVGGTNPAELQSLAEIEKKYILHVLEAAGGNRALAARTLGLDRKTLYRKLQRYQRSDGG